MILNRNQLETFSQNDLIEKVLALQTEAYPGIGPSYKFQLGKAVKKIEKMSSVNKNLLTDPNLRNCYSCKFIHEQTCSKIRKQNLAALVKWSGCGLHEFRESEYKKD